MSQISDFEEFSHNGYTISTDLGSARRIDEEYRTVVSILGKAYSNTEDEIRQVEVNLIPEDTPKFNVSTSASEGELTRSDLDAEAVLLEVEDVETEEKL